MQPITLEQISPVELVSAFNDAFATYAVKVQMTAAKLENVIRARSVHLDRSFGFLEQDRLAAFMLTGSRRIDERPIAYNAGTGVRRRYQRQGLGRRLLTHTMDVLQALGYHKYLLEVITTNTAAISLYTGQGFTERRLLHSYSAPKPVHLPTTGGAAVAAVDAEWAHRMAALQSHTPAWQNADAAVNAIADHCRLITAGPAAAPTAMAVLDPRYGILHQFGFAPGNADVARKLVARAMEYTSSDAHHLINVDSEDERINLFLREAGFGRTISQLEMDFCWE
ncbi:MAG: GNAT family N-acetyltransferase [Candidatus Thiodiazotropha sp.]